MQELQPFKDLVDNVESQGPLWSKNGATYSPWPHLCETTLHCTLCFFPCTWLCNIYFFVSPSRLQKIKIESCEDFSETRSLIIFLLARTATKDYSKAFARIQMGAELFPHSRLFDPWLEYFVLPLAVSSAINIPWRYPLCWMVISGRSCAFLRKQAWFLSGFSRQQRHCTPMGRRFVKEWTAII